MAKDKSKFGLNKTRDLGTITKKLVGGMYLTDKEEKIPPLPGFEIGDKVKLVNGNFVAEGKEAKRSSDPIDAKDKRIAELEAKNKALEAKLGELGSKVGAIEASMTERSESAAGLKTPPKVGE